MSIFAAVDADLFGGERVAIEARPNVAHKDIARFMAKVMKDDDGCWRWAGAIARDVRYGKFKYQRRSWLAHRWSYTAFVADIPAEMFIDHLCRNRECVNPAHLEVVTPAENSRRRPWFGPANHSVCHACGQSVEVAS